MNFFQVLQVILFKINCSIFYTNLHELFCQFISSTNWVNSGKFMDNWWISCQVMADMKNFYDDLMIITLYPLNNFHVNTKCEIVPQTLVYFTRKRRRKQISIVVQLRLKKEILLNTCCLHTTMIWNTWQWDQNHPLSWNLTVNSVGSNFNSLK